MTLEHTKPWSPPVPAEVKSLFEGSGSRWWVAGGFALEMATGRSWRTHGDIDVLMLRPDVQGLRGVLRGWDLWVADPPGHLRHWPEGETLKASVHDIWCRKSPEADWSLQVMLDECEDGHWTSRRNSAVSLSINDIGRMSADGIPFLRPEIQLYYKAKNARPKDEHDFAETLPHLEDDGRDWLNKAITTAYGADHPWLATLRR